MNPINTIINTKNLQMSIEPKKMNLQMSVLLIKELKSINLINISYQLIEKHLIKNNTH